MSLGRIVATSSAVILVGGCAVIVVGMAAGNAERTKHRHVADRQAVDTAPLTNIPAQLPGTGRDVRRVTNRPARVRSTHPARHAAVAPTTSAPATSHTVVPLTSAVVTAVAPSPSSSTPAPVRTTATSTRASRTPTHTPTHTPTPTTSTPAPAPSTSRATTRAAAQPHRAAAPRRGVHLPVSGFTGRAQRVITVRARSTSSTTAILRTWHKAAGGGWIQVGKGVLAHIGSDGMSRSASEYRSATPIGSFTLTQAFGAYGNPGTSLHYFKTNGADWWISQSGRLYNTHQHCWSGCSFNQGSPNEHLRYETPYYNYAVVIDYNTRNSPTGVRQGAGSAFFLHVHPSGTGATAGCVSIPQGRLKTIMRWLLPSKHPRILIGTG